MVANRIGYRQILSISWPIVLQMSLQTIITNVNVMMMSRLGNAAVATVGITGTIMGIFSILLTIVSFGATVLVAQHYGAEDEAATSQLLVESERISLLFSITISALVLAVPSLFMHWMNVPRDIWTETKWFLRLNALIFPLPVLTMLTTGLLRCVGHSKSILIASGLCLVLVVVLNRVFLFGFFGIPAFGLGGLVISDAIVFSGGAAWGIWLLKRHVRNVSLRSMMCSWRHTETLIRVGIPSAIDSGSYQLTQIIIVALISLLGSSCLAVRQYALAIESLSFLIGLGVAEGVTILVGQMVGVGQGEMVKRLAWKGIITGTLLLTATAIPLYANGSHIIQWFTKDQSVIQTGAHVLKIIAIAQPAKGLNMVVGGVLRGAGDNKWLMFNSGAFVWFSVVFSFLLGFTFHFGMDGIWWGMVLDEWLRGIWVLSRIASNRWRPKSYVSSSQGAPFSP